MNINDSAIQKAIRDSIRDGILKAIKQMREKLKMDGDVVDRAIEDVIPEEISGDKRFRLKDEIRKRLKEDGTIKWKNA